MNSGKPLRKNVGHRGEDQQMFVLSNLTWVISSSPNKIAWPGGEEGWSQMIGWDPKTEVGTPSRQRK